MRFAVRRPATRPASPSGHRPPGGDVLALRVEAARQLTVRDDFTDASPAERTGRTGVRDLTPQGRTALARVLMGPAGADLDVPEPGGGSWDGLASGPLASAAARSGLDVPAATGGSWDRRSAPVGAGTEGTALTGVVADSTDGPWTWDGLASGPVAGPPAPAEAGTTDLDLIAPGEHGRVVAGEDPEVLTPTRVMAGRPPARPCGETVHQLGETTDSLLLRHLRTRPAKDAPRPAGPLGLNRPARPPVLDAPSTTTEIPRRERRPLPGRKAGASAPRTR